MTLIVAICIEENDEQSLLISSDSQALMGQITYKVHKIEPIFEPIEGKEPIAIAAGAGDTAIIKKAIDISQNILWETSIANWEKKTPTYDQFKEVVSKIELELIGMIKFYKQKCEDFGFEFLLGSLSSEGYPSLYLFDNRAISQPVHDEPGFACIGSGFFLGGNLLLQQFHSRNMSIGEVVHLTAEVINRVSKVDAGVGPFEGESWWFRLKDGKPFLGSIPPKSKFVKELREECDDRQELLRYIWRKSVNLGSKDLEKVIKKPIKELEKAIKELEKGKKKAKKKQKTSTHKSA